MHPVNTIIQVMTKREKFYFSKLYHASANKNFFKLYVAIEKNPQVQVIELKKMFSDSKISKNIFTDLNYLYEQVLRTLHIYRINSKDPESRILKNLQYVNILLEKGRNKQARKILLKAKKEAYKAEQYSLLIKIITIQEELDISTIDSDLPLKMKILQQEREMCLVQIQNYIELKQLRAQLIDLQYKEGLFIEDLQKYKKILKHPLLKKKKKATSLKAINFWHFSKGMVNHFQGNYIKAKKFDLKRIQFMKKHPHLFNEIELIKAKNNIIFLLIDMRSFEEGRILISEFASYYKVKTVPDEMIIYFENYLRLKLETFAGNVDFLREFVPRSIGLLDQCMEELNDTQINDWYRNMVIALIELNDYEVAMSILHEWLSQDSKRDINIYAHFLRLICYFESGASLLVQNEIRSCLKFMRLKKIESKTMKALIKYLQASIKEPDQKIFYKEELLEKFQEYKDSPSERKYFLHINLWNWACQ